ncbi:AAA family ATPase [Niveispirillum sp. KHB5.9]|uniref:AAA family ATPase n=1 Tax=Niveispirillum sp. KHB5.9 TaxID=3400269 RepID=UPI003A8419D8
MTASWNRAPGPANPGGYVEKLDTICAASWAGKPVPERQWLIPDLIPLRDVTSVNGRGGEGKTLIVLQLLASAALGMPWLGRQCRRVNTLGVFCEDESDELQRRLHDIATAYGVDLGDMEHLDLASRVGEDNALLTFGKYGESADPTPFYSSILRRARQLGAELIVLDSLYDFFPGNENARTEVHRFGGMLRALAKATGAAVVVCGHPSRAGEQEGSGLSGSTAWHAVVRSRLYLTRPAAEEGAPQNSDARILASKKANYAALAGDIRLTYRDGVFVADIPSGGDFVDKLDHDARARAAEDAFLACLRAAAGQGRAVSDAANSPRYAPRIFITMKEAGGLRQADFVAAMRTLFDARRIRIGEVPGPDRHRQKSIVEVPNGAP